MNAATVGKSFRMREIIHNASRGTYHLRSLIILDSIFFPLNHFRLLSILNSTNIPYPQIGSGQTKSFEGVPFRRESAACTKQREERRDRMTLGLPARRRKSRVARLKRRRSGREIDFSGSRACEYLEFEAVLCCRWLSLPYEWSISPGLSGSPVGRLLLQTSAPLPKAEGYKCTSVFTSPRWYPGLDIRASPPGTTFSLQS